MARLQESMGWMVVMITVWFMWNPVDPAWIAEWCVEDGIGEVIVQAFAGK